MEDNKSLPWQGQVPVKDERAGAGWGHEVAAAATEPLTAGQAGSGAVSQVERQQGREEQLLGTA